MDIEKVTFEELIRLLFFSGLPPVLFSIVGGAVVFTALVIYKKMVSGKGLQISTVLKMEEKYEDEEEESSEEFVKAGEEESTDQAKST